MACRSAWIAGRRHLQHGNGAPRHKPTTTLAKSVLLPRGFPRDGCRRAIRALCDGLALRRPARRLQPTS